MNKWRGKGSGGERKRKRESKILSPLFCHGIRMEAREEVYIEIVFVSVKGGGKIRGCFEADEGCNDASDELKLVKGGLMRINRRKKTNLYILMDLSYNFII